MTELERFDVLVVSGGKGGKTLAMDLAQAGRRVAMVERAPEMIGGTCINLACIPTKTLIRSAEVAELVRRAADFGVDANLGELTATAVRARKDEIVHAMREMNLGQFRASGMELVIGAARFVGPRRVQVSTDGGVRVLEGERAVLDLGTRPAVPDIPGLAGARPLTSDTLLALERIPDRLLVLGGSYVGVELAQALHRLGSRVTVVERGPQLLAREDSDALDDYRIVRSNLDGAGRTTRDRLIPYCVFLDPELGRVGLTEREARRRGHDVRIARLPASAVPRAKTLNETRGLLKAVVERGSDRILGAAIFAAHGGEVIATIQAAMLGGLPSAALRDGVLAHPTMAEGLNQLFASWVD